MIITHEWEEIDLHENLGKRLTSKGGDVLLAWKATKSNIYALIDLRDGMIVEIGEAANAVKTLTRYNYKVIEWN